MSGQFLDGIELALGDGLLSGGNRLCFDAMADFFESSRCQRLERDGSGGATFRSSANDDGLLSDVLGGVLEPSLVCGTVGTSGFSRNASYVQL